MLRKVLSFAVALIMLVSVFPLGVFAEVSYTVTLMAGPEGQGSSVTLTKKSGEVLSLAHLRADITSQYGMEPKGGNSDQRVFIMWAEGYNSTTSRGTGKTYFDTYNEDANITLYAIWGYPIMFNADGGRYADGSTKKLEYVANYAEWRGESTDPKSMYRYNMPDWNGDVPVKEGARRVGNGAGPNGKGYAYALVNADGKSVFTWEGYGENLTIPPVGGAYYPSGNSNGATWSMFKCISENDPENPYGIAFPEFYAVWEPEVTYDPNGGNGNGYSEYMTWDWVMWKYESYTIDQNSFTNSGAKFTGWNTEPDGSGRTYPAGRKITNTPSKDSNGFTLYAQWEYDHEHSYNSVVTQPTCGSEGKTVYTCTQCSHSYTEVISATGEHNYESAVIAPTCVADGKTVYTCVVCADSYEETIPATLEHSYGEWSVVSEPTYFDEGKEERICEVCQNAEERTIPVMVLENPFIDVNGDHWFYDSVIYCVKKGYVSGMTENTFVPNGKLTRAQFLVLLAKFNGVDLTQYSDVESGFSDVKTNHWYNEVVCWAVEKGITSGISETLFGPNNNVTRAQLARFFYVYCEKNDISLETGPVARPTFPDADKTPAWAKEVIDWAVNAQLISGMLKENKIYLEPNGTATRAQAARMFMTFDAYCEK